MKTFLGLIMVLIVSGERCETVSSILHGSVLLPCNCSKRGVDEPFFWQKESPKKIQMLAYSNGNSTFKPGYKGRGKIFLHEHGNNCSLLLTNVTAEDQGQYKCIFRSQGVLDRIDVNLTVSVNYHVCQNFTACHVKGLYRDAEIEWNLDGRPLTSSPTTNITLNDSTGLYHFTSKLITSFNETSRLTCTVKAKGVSATIIDDCILVKEGRTDEMPLRYRYLTIIPIALMLGFFLFLWRRLKFLESMPIRRRETGNCYCRTGKTDTNVTI